MGGRNARSKSYSQQVSYGQEVWDPQQAYLQDIYGKAQQSYNAYNPASDQAAIANWQRGLQAGEQTLGAAIAPLQMAERGYQQGYGQLDQAGQGYGRGYAGLDEAMANYRRFQNPGANPMMDVYARQVGQQFREQIMPGLQGQAAMAGGMGGSRAQIGQALAGARMGQTMQDFAAQLYGQDMDRALAATQGMQQTGMGYGQLAQGQGQLGGMYGQLAQGQGQLSNMYGRIGEAQANMGAAYGDLGQYAQQTYWSPLAQYSAMIGKPVALDQGGHAESKSRSFNRGFGMATG